MGSLLAFALAVVAAPSDAQQAGADSDADRIARSRDQAMSEGRATDNAAPGVENSAEPQPLPPNEQLPLGASESSALLGGAGTDQGASGGLGDGWLLSTLAALGVVLALVFGLRWLLRRSGVATASAPQGGVVEVLSRTTVAPRSHVVLMRVGQRILVVNDSPAGMRTLATVEEPEEVAELLGAVEAAKPTSMTKSFSGVMAKLSGGWSAEAAGLEAGALDPDDAAFDDGVTIDQTRSAVSNVRGRLAALSGGGIQA